MIDLYRKISEEILKELKSNACDEKIIEAKLDKRQELLNKLSQREVESFIAVYSKEGLCDLDKEIKKRLSEEIADVKKEIREYKTKREVNTAYANMNKNKLNLFLKKV